MLPAIKQLLGKLGIDWAIIYTIFARTIQAVGGVGTVIFIVKCLDKNEQGYYYTFGSIIALQIFFELGLNGIITQYVAHEMAHLRFDENLNLEGEPMNQSRLASLLHFCVRWFSFLGLGLFLVLLLVGYVFFTRYEGSVEVHWQGPYAVLCMATAGFMFLDPLLAFLEGLGKVKDVARFRLIQQTTYIVLVITLLLAGFKLYAGAFAALVSCISMLLMLVFSECRTILQKIHRLEATWKVSYRKEIFPYQWKIALSWISGYFVFQFFNPVLFATEGPVVAGQMGMSINALNGVLGLSMAWIYTKVPRLSGFISLKQYIELDKLFFRSFFQSLFINVLSIAGFFTVATYLQRNGFVLGSRFLSGLPLAFLCSTFVINQMIFSMSVYLRCHKTEPLLYQSIVLGILSFCSTVFLGRAFGVTGITAGYFGVMLTVSLPWVIIIFNKFRTLHPQT